MPLVSVLVLTPLCRAVLALFVVGVTLDFGGVVDHLQPAIALVPSLLLLLICSVREPPAGSAAPVHAFLWFAAGGAMLLTAALQLSPIPEGLVAALSPAAATIHRNAHGVATILDPATAASASFRLSVAPELTSVQLMRIVGCIATFLLSTMLFSGRRARLQLALFLAALAVFEVVYGYRQWTGDQRTIWGWENEAGIHRVSGTFVNANHYAHFLAVILPVVLYAVFSAWSRARRNGRGKAETTAAFVEQHAWIAVPAAAASLAIVIGILLSGSRGAFVSLLVATAAVTLTRAALGRSSSTQPLQKRRWVVPAALLASFVVGTMLLGLVLRQDVITSRLVGADALDVAGRTAGWTTAGRVIRLFPVSGSGLGTFPAVAASVQDPELEKLFTRAHNDYLELLATGGLLAGTAVILLALGGWLALLLSSVRLPRENRDEIGVSSDRQLYMACASASIGTALVHALFDFNSQIPANAILWALVAGAASTLYSRSRARNV